MQPIARANSRRGFTLLEMMAVIVVLGIAGALVIPAMGETGVLKVQAAVRTIVSDITFIQSDAVAFQERRAIVFDVPNSTYRLLQVPGNTLDAQNDTMYDPTRPGGQYVVDFRDEKFGDSRITGAEFGTVSYLIFDALGGPVADPGSNAPGPGGTVRVTGSGQTFAITVDAFTGRVRVAREATPPTP